MGQTERRLRAVRLCGVGGAAPVIPSVSAIPLLDSFLGKRVLLVGRVRAVLAVHGVEFANERVDVRAAHEMAVAAAFLTGYCVCHGIQKSANQFSTANVSDAP